MRAAVAAQAHHVAQAARRMTLERCWPPVQRRLRHARGRRGRPPLTLVAALLGVSASAPLARAQGADVIRGQITALGNVPVENAAVTATSLSGGVNRTAHSDKDGRYTIIFPGGEGDYFVSVIALGYAPQRFEVRRIADQDILVADARMRPAAAMLDSVRVVAPRARVSRGLDTLPDIGGTEQKSAPTALAPGEQGDLNALAATVPGVTPVLGTDGQLTGFSVLGAAADQNNITLNGNPFNGASLPRDASISASVVTAPYDVSRGGFSGGQVSIHASPGTNFVRRTVSLNMNAPPLEWGDPAAQALGQEYTNISFGGLLAGPLIYDEAFYNVSYQIGRRTSDLRTLLNSGPLALATSGIGADSVTRLLALLSGAGIPAEVAGRTARDRVSESGSMFGSVDFAPPTSTTGQSLNVTFNGSWNRQTAAGETVRDVPARGEDRTNASGNLQVSETAYLHRTLLTETTIGVSAARSTTSPYLALPSGTVLVNSSLADSTLGVTTLGFGGSPASAIEATAIGGFAHNELSWFTTSNKHRLKLATEIRDDGYRQQQPATLGSFAYNSLADLAANQPASFARSLTPQTATGSRAALAVSLGDSYRRSDALQFQFGLRADANRFSTAPTRNALIESTFGVRNNNVPNRVYASPRIGLSWSYGASTGISAFEGAATAPRGVVRGGLGVFQDVPDPSFIGDAISNTGLPESLRRMACIGSAVPIPDWVAYGADPSRIPTGCADGSTGTVFAESAPDVVLFAKDYSAPQSVRSNLQWTGPVLRNRFALTAEGVYSLNRRQPDVVDLNFRPAVQFRLASEAGRPVFVAPTAIVPSTGAVASSQSRVSPLFNRVSERVSDLSGMTRQFRLSLAPLKFSQTFRWDLSYVYTSSRAQVGGFSSTGGTPLGAVWARSGVGARHQITYDLDYNLFNTARVHWYGRFQSGAPFTPIVASDINGDGYVNDRAFVFAPGTAPDSGVAASMQSLLASSGNRVRDCLQHQLNRIAGINSCVGPWTATANLSVSLNPLKLHLPQRASVSLNVSNPLGAADIVMHGENRLHGWGRSAIPDPALLYVDGFDPATRAFRYQVNPRFGSTSPRVQQLRAPVIVTLSVRIDLGPSRERQVLLQELDRGRGRAGEKVPEYVLKSAYANGGLINPMTQMLRQSDVLSLTGAQADSIATMNREYTVRLDSIWSATTHYWAALPSGYDRDRAYNQYKRSREATIDLLIALVPRINAVLTADQKRKLPPAVASELDVGYLRRIRSSTVGGASSGAFGTAAPGH